MVAPVQPTPRPKSQPTATPTVQPIEPVSGPVSPTLAPKYPCFYRNFSILFEFSFLVIDRQQQASATNSTPPSTTPRSSSNLHTPQVHDHRRYNLISALQTLSSFGVTYPREWLLVLRSYVYLIPPKERVCVRCNTKDSWGEQSKSKRRIAIPP